MLLLTPIQRALTLLCAVAILAACGGGGSGGTSAPISGPVPIPLPSAQSSPTPASSAPPAVTPSPTPTPAPVQFSPTNTFNFNATGAQYAQSLTVTQSGYDGGFTPGTQCTGVVSVMTISPRQSSIVPIGPGTCMLQFANTLGEQVGAVYVQVTTTSIIGS